MSQDAFGKAHYLRLQRRLRNLLVSLEDRLPSNDRRTVAELIDANECGLARQTIGDALVGESIPVEETVMEEIRHLADEMDIAAEIAAPLRPSPVG